MAKEPVIGIPTLHSITNPVLTKVEDVVAYLIRFLFANPGSTSSLNEGEMLSFRKLVSNFGNQQLDMLQEKIGSMLTTSIQHFFPHENYTATCTVEMEDGKGDDGSYLGNYGVVISVKDPNNNPVCPLSKYKISKDFKTIDVVL